jgi:cytochrome c556
MVKGDAPFDLAKAKAVFATYAESAVKMTPMFPVGSNAGDTTAAPKIWEAKADFDAKLKKFGDDSKAAEAATKDLDSFKSQFGAVMRNCGGCHETYRIKKSQNFLSAPSTGRAPDRRRPVLFCIRLLLWIP